MNAEKDTSNGLNKKILFDCLSLGPKIPVKEAQHQNEFREILPDMQSVLYR
jgi:hypothetical protein